MKKRILLILLCVTFQHQVATAQDCELVLMQASDLYKDGSYQSIPDLLLDCIGSYKGDSRHKAYFLMVNSLLLMKRNDERKAYAETLLSSLNRVEVTLMLENFSESGFAPSPYYYSYRQNILSSNRNEACTDDLDIMNEWWYTVGREYSTEKYQKRKAFRTKKTSPAPQDSIFNVGRRLFQNAKACSFDSIPEQVKFNELQLEMSLILQNDSAQYYKNKLNLITGYRPSRLLRSGQFIEYYNNVDDSHWDHWRLKFPALTVPLIQSDDEFYRTNVGSMIGGSYVFKSFPSFSKIRENAKNFPYGNSLGLEFDAGLDARLLNVYYERKLSDTTSVKMREHLYSIAPHVTATFLWTNGLAELRANLGLTYGYFFYDRAKITKRSNITEPKTQLRTIVNGFQIDNKEKYTSWLKFGLAYAGYTGCLELNYYYNPRHLVNPNKQTENTRFLNQYFDLQMGRYKLHFIEFNFILGRYPRTYY